MSIYRISAGVPPLGSQISSLLEADPSLGAEKAGSLEREFVLSKEDFDELFFSKYRLKYISDYFAERRLDLRVVTHPEATNTCYEKADLLGNWSPLNVVKVLYLEHCPSGAAYGIAVPETGCFINRKTVGEILGLGKSEPLAKAKVLPVNMSFGTCSPFVQETDLVVRGGRVAKIVFDTETLIAKKHEQHLDDFSFGLNHRMSVQMNYYHCYRMLKCRYPLLVADEEILTMLFTERFCRTQGKIRVAYSFESVSYRVAKFIHDTHGDGDVSIVNDYSDELYLPDVLTVPATARSEVDEPAPCEHIAEDAF